MKRQTALGCLLVALLAAVPVLAGDRLVLVIGNGAYRNIPALPNPVNDARLMARTLEDAGYHVTMDTEADRAAMERAVERFDEDLRAARPGIRISRPENPTRSTLRFVIPSCSAADK